MERSGYLPMLRAWARQSAAPFWWFVDDTHTTRAAIQHNGSICFLDTGERIIGVTADHVYQSYLADLERGPIVCQFGSIPFQPEKRLISHNEKIDLATFDVPKFMVAAAGCSPHGSPHWPPPGLSEGEVVMAGGFPGPLREERETTAEFPFVTLATRVRQSSDAHAALQLELASSMWGTKERLQPGADLGGMSGGPVYRYHSEGIERLLLAGFIFEYGENVEIMLARQASHVAPDGTVLPLGTA